MDSRNYTLPQDSEERKLYPLFTGVMRFFPAAVAAVARHIKRGADKHCNGRVVWRRGTSDDHEDCILRHLMDLADKRREMQGEVGYARMQQLYAEACEEAAAIAWRALALCQVVHEHYAYAPVPESAEFDQPPFGAGAPAKNGASPSASIDPAGERPFDLTEALAGAPGCPGASKDIGIGDVLVRMQMAVDVGLDDDVPFETPPAGTRPFALKDALAGAPLVTRDGRKAINFKVRDDLEDEEEDYACPYPYSADVEIEKGGAYDRETYRADGGFRIASTSRFDLYMVPVERKPSPFNLSAALAGAPRVTRSGKRADDFRMDASEEDGSADYPYSARISHDGIAWRSSYTAAGRAVSDEIDNVGDLFMAPLITKAFDLDAALAGAPLVTADGRMVTDFGKVRCEGSKPSHPYAAVVNNEDGSRVWWVYGADGTLGGWKPELSLAWVSVD